MAIFVQNLQQGGGTGTAGPTGRVGELEFSGIVNVYGWIVFVDDDARGQTAIVRGMTNDIYRLSRVKVHLSLFWKDFHQALPADVCESWEPLIM